MSIEFYQSGNRLAEATIANGLIFLAGQVPTNEDADITAQTADVLAQIDTILAACGSDKQHICEAVIYLSDMQEYAGMNQAWDNWVTPGKAPARACVQAALANPKWKVEIKLTAVQK
ncbi:RidA family protein [Snodgrassella sp. ESL0253]|uniref:RidA family protein n=1 Tax=Snodgrassella sp. ESL0253 TaxID=2705031 RepID=UPI001581EBF8|nr:RidA family protein [Snodgrassella sp. ESL0253]NUE65984.1 RidA family protein [Snodgrassella sp. ESL0253]